MHFAFRSIGDALVMDEIKRKEAAASLLKDMESTAARMRELIVAMPPHDLLGYLYAQYMRKAMVGQSSDSAQHKVKAPDVGAPERLVCGRFSVIA